MIDQDSVNMADLHHRLGQLRPRIENLMRLGGTPGLSVSVATKGQPTYHAGYGFQDVLSRLPVTEKTIFPVCSLAKAISAAGVGILVDEGLVSWDTLVRDVVPEFRPADDRLRQASITLADLLSHTSGMSSCGNLIMGCEGNVLIDEEDCLPMLNDQILIPKKVGSFSYNSTGYDLCSAAVTRLSGQTEADFINTRVFEPLDMRRSFLHSPPSGTENVAICYNALDDGTTVPVPSPKLGDNGVGGGSGGLQSCGADLIKFYTTFISSFNDQLKSGITSTTSSPLKQITRLTSSTVPMFPTGSGNDTAYGLGWARVQLPSTLGHIGINSRLIPHDMPVVGKGAASQLVLYHQGTLPGALAVVMLLPDSESVILVMSNCLSLTDVPDWVSQMILEELIGVPPCDRVDFWHYAEVSVATNLLWYERLVGSLKQELEEAGTMDPHKELSLYEGTYVDASGIFKNIVTLEDGVLYWSFQGRESERYKLTHHTGNVSTWLQPRNELSRRGRWVLGDNVDTDFWKAGFQMDNDGKVVTLAWKHDPELEPIVYHKK